MAHELFDRRAMRFRPLGERRNRVFIERDKVLPGSPYDALPPESAKGILQAASEIRRARDARRPVILAFGAHAIKNGLSPLLIDLLDRGWVTHLATNGAGIIHDWEFAYLGESSENVRENIEVGQFGTWEETCRYLNLAIAVGAYEGMGYGESVGALVERDGLTMPSHAELVDALARAESDPARAAAAADLLELQGRAAVESGFHRVAHPHKQFGLQAHAFRRGVPYTAHPMFGHDIIYTHPLNCGAAIGRTAERDFLAFVHSVSGLEGGVYLSVGSAVMSPMIFEKAMSMARNVAIQRGEAISDFGLYVVDLSAVRWDWSKGEPPESDPAYYVRFLKTFSRVGGRMTYIQADNRAFFLALHEALGPPGAASP